VTRRGRFTYIWPWQMPFLGRQSEADATAAQARKLNPKLTVKWYGARLDAPETIHEGLRKAGVPEE